MPLERLGPKTYLTSRLWHTGDTEAVTSGRLFVIPKEANLSVHAVSFHEWEDFSASDE